MENKKISFGFSKISKKTEIISKPSKPDKKVELIDCLEGQSIKIKDAIEETNEPLVIPIQGSSNKLLDDIIKAKEKRSKKEIIEVKEEESVPDSALTLDELAARELIREAQNRDTIKTETKIYSLPLKEEDKLVLDGAEEPSLQDYENIPISDYGMAMLRGMNWKEGMPIGKRAKKAEISKLPELRPKGLGLGANKMVNSAKPTKTTDKDGKELQLIKGAFCKIIAGNHRGHYCEIQGLDDENCRVIVKTALTHEVLNLNEFLIVPVNKDEYESNSRVINNSKYEEYKDKSRRVRSRSRSNDRSKKKKKKSKKYTSDSDDDKRKHKKKNKTRYKSNDSDSDRDYRRKDKKR